MKKLSLIALLLFHWSLSSISILPKKASAQQSEKSVLPTKFTRVQIQIELNERRIRFNRDRVENACRKQTIIEQQNVIIEQLEK